MRVRKLMMACVIPMILSPQIYARPFDSPKLVIGAGAFDFARNEVAEGRLELRFTNSGFIVQPILGLLATRDRAKYGYAGLNFEIALPGDYKISVNSAFGTYFRGAGKNLGGVAEFRSGIELQYALSDFLSIGASLHHISNASLYRRNPGSNTLGIFLQIGM